MTKIRALRTAARKAAGNYLKAILAMALDRVRTVQWRSAKLRELRRRRGG